MPMSLLKKPLDFPLSMEGPVPILTSRFGYRIHPVKGTRKLHTGIDIGLPMGTPIFAPADGVVSSSYSGKGGEGSAIFIKHGKWKTGYFHLTNRIVKKGDKVVKGQMIAQSGGCRGCPGAGTSTGAHLHFEVRLLDESTGKYDKVDPLRNVNLKSPLRLSSKLKRSMQVDTVKTTVLITSPIFIAVVIGGVWWLRKRK